MSKIRQHDIQCIQFVKVAVPANRRTGAAICRFFPVVQANPRSPRQLRFTDPAAQTGRLRRDVVENPMHPCHFRCGRVGCVRIVDNQRKALCTRRRARPRQCRRTVGAVAGVLRRNRSSRAKSDEVRDKLIVVSIFAYGAQGGAGSPRKTAVAAGRDIPTSFDSGIPCALHVLRDSGYGTASGATGLAAGIQDARGACPGSRTLRPEARGARV